MSDHVKALWDKLWFVNMGYTNKIWLIDWLMTKSYSCWIFRCIFFNKKLYRCLHWHEKCFIFFFTGLTSRTDSTWERWQGFELGNLDYVEEIMSFWSVQIIGYLFHCVPDEADSLCLPCSLLYFVFPDRRPEFFFFFDGQTDGRKTVRLSVRKKLNFRTDRRTKKCPSVCPEIFFFFWRTDRRTLQCIT